MLLAQINGLGKLTPITPGSSGDFRAKSNEKTNAKGIKEDSTNTSAEKGKAWIRINPLNEVDINDILEIYVIGSQPINGKIIAQKKSFLKGLEIEVYFEEAFDSGFTPKMQEVIYPGGGMIGFTSLELRKLKSIEFQRQVSEILIDFMMSDSSEEIKKVSKPCYVLGIQEDGDSRSHFCGLPKFGFQKKHPLNTYGQQLFHLGTFKSEDLAPIYNKYSNYELLQRLSFYIDIRNTEKGWPVESDRFKVLTYNSLEENIPESNNYEHKKPVYFNPMMDFPHFHHSAIERLELSDEEIQRYNAFRSTFNHILGIKDISNYKLFGYPDVVERCISFEAERLKSKKSYANINWEASNKWMLLLQLSPLNNDFEFFREFGSGIIYFMINKGDLKRGFFKDVQVVVQPLSSPS